MPAATDDATEAASAARVETAPTCTNAEALEARVEQSEIVCRDVAYDSGFTATDAGNIVLTASVIPLPATRTSRRRGNRASFATPSLVRP